ncbi:unnamed protein product [Victoria cruziana]
MSSRFLLLAGILYKRGFHNEYLRCINHKEAVQIVKEAHDGICGGHVRYQTLSRQILRAGYTVGSIACWIALAGSGMGAEDH